MIRYNHVVRWLLASVLLIGALTPAEVEAQSDDQLARTHFLAGSSYYRQRRYELALREFQESYRLSGRAPLLKNVATALERLNRFSEAADTLEQYLRESPQADDRATVETSIRQLRERAVEAETAGEGESTETTESGNVLGDAPEPPDADGAGPSALLVTSIALFGVAAAAAGVSIATGVISNDRLATLDSSCPDRRCDPSLQPIRAEGEDFALVSTITMFSAATVAVAALVLLIADLTGGGNGSDEDPDDENAFRARAPRAFRF